MSLHPQHLSAAILAGGKSTRMGQNKALLRFGGHTIIERIVAAVRHVTHEIAVITNTPEQYRFLNLPIHADEVAGIGPLGGVYSALKRCAAERCLIVACDLPFVSPALLLSLCEQAESCDAIGVASEHGLEPLCAIYSKSCLPVIQRQIAQQDYRVHRLFSSVRSKRLPLALHTRHSQPPVLFNVNTPQDLAQARRYAADE